MKPKNKKPIKLPDVNEKSLSYALHSIEVAAKGCYDDNKKLRLDEGFGDYNMRLFRFKDRKKYLKNIPSAFTPSIQRLLQYNANDPKEKRIATQHNQQIDKILNEPKEVYLDIIRKEREIEERKRQEQIRKYEFIKGEDREVRECNEHLSFNYLPNHEANQWFKVIDHSNSYVSPTPFSFNISAVSFSASPAKPRKKKGHIFFSDEKLENFKKRW